MPPLRGRLPGDAVTMGDQQRERGSDQLKQFEGRLGKARAAIREKDAAQGMSPLGMAFRIASELVVSVLVGGAIGWGLDYWFNTTPLFLLIFFVAGTAAGVKNVFRSAKAMQYDASRRPGGDDEAGPKAKDN